MQVSTSVGVVQAMVFLTFFGRQGPRVVRKKTLAQPRRERKGARCPRKRVMHSRQSSHALRRDLAFLRWGGSRFPTRRYDRAMNADANMIAPRRRRGALRSG